MQSIYFFMHCKLLLFILYIICYLQPYFQHFSLAAHDLLTAAHHLLVTLPWAHHDFQPFMVPAEAHYLHQWLAGYTKVLPFSYDSSQHDKIQIAWPNYRRHPGCVQHFSAKVADPIAHFTFIIPEEDALNGLCIKFISKFIATIHKCITINICVHGHAKLIC